MVTTDFETAFDSLDREFPLKIPPDFQFWAILYSVDSSFLFKRLSCVIMVLQQTTSVLTGGLNTGIPYPLFCLF